MFKKGFRMLWRGRQKEKMLNYIGDFGRSLRLLGLYGNEVASRSYYRRVGTIGREKS